ncbi:MAG: hypothetical protein QM496_04805 [Verrucomicrobiota bacterium]
MKKAATILLLSLVFIPASLFIHRNFIAKPNFDFSVKENTGNRLEIKVLPTSITNSIYGVKFYDSNGLEIAHKTINQKENVYSIDGISKYTYPISIECQLQFDQITPNTGTFTETINKSGD